MKKRMAKRALSVILAVIMTLSCLSACMSIIALAADGWTYIAGSTQRVERSLYVKQDQFYTSGLIGGSGKIIDGNAASKAVTVGASGGSTTLYTTATGTDTWWAWTEYIVGDEEIDACVLTKTGNGGLYNETTKKYIGRSGSSLTASTTETKWTFGTNKIYNGSYYMTASGSNIALSTSSSSTISAYNYAQKVYVEETTAGGYYRQSGPTTYNVEQGSSLTASEVESKVEVQYKTSSSATTYTTLKVGQNDITLTWNKTLDTSVPDTYTATVKLGSTVLDTITVTVSKEEVPATTYIQYTPKTSGQILEEGTYVFWNEGYTCLLLGESKSGGGLNIAFDDSFSISSNELSTSLINAPIKVTVANASNNTYYFQTADGKYISINSSTTREAATLTTTPTALQVITLDGKIAIGVANSNYYLNCYHDSKAIGVWSNGLNDVNNRFVAYKLPETVTANNYYKYTPNTSGQYLEEGTYVFWNEGGTRLLLGKAASGGGAVSSQVYDFTISGDVLTTKLNSAEIKVTVANAASNTYYFQTYDGKYFSIAGSSTLAALTLTDTPTALQVNVSNGKIGIHRTNGDYYINCYNGNGNFGIYSGAMNDVNNRFVAYKLPAETYEYVGSTLFIVNKGESFNVNSIKDDIKVLYKESEELSDSEGVIFTLDDDEVTLTWNQTVDTSKEGEYTATVYADGKAVAEITVRVEEYKGIVDTKADPSTSDIEDWFTKSPADDGKIATDKTVYYNGDEFNAFSAYESDEFSVALSALGQSYEAVETEEIVTEEKLHPDVVFVIDASGSMRQYTVAGSTTVTRAEATAVGLNEAIKELYAADPETRIGITTYGFGIYTGVYLPLDKYTLPEGQTDYITWGGRMVASSGGTINDGHSYAVKTTSASGTVSDIKQVSQSPGYQSRSGSYSYYRPAASELTTIATVNGITYYAGRGSFNRNDIIYIFTSSKEAYVAMLYSSASGTNTNVFMNDDITITYASSTSVTYTTNSYSNRSSNVKLSFESQPYMMATNFLINSSGQVVRPSAHQFVTSVGTFTQAGLQKAEDMFSAVSNKQNRVPSIVIISDGIPTVSDTNTTTPHLEQTDGVTVGYGLSAGGGTSSQELASHGLRTIETAISTKQTVNNMYYSVNHGRNANFYTIGPGVDYIFGQTILNPTNENIAAAAAKTTNVGEDSESGVGVPSDLASTISSKYSNLDYVDYADWSFTGDVDSETLTNAFKDIVSSIVEVERPITTISSSSSTEIDDDFTGAMVFTDVIGDGMKINGAPVVRYGGKNYTSNVTPVTVTNADGSTSTTYKYNYTVTESSTDKKYNLSGLEVIVTTAANGKQTVKWNIPVELVPIIVHNGVNNEYRLADPIRLIYKVGLTDESINASGTYYTNSTSEPAKAEFVPTVGNPYYYSAVEGSDGKTHSVLKSNLDTSTDKTDNVTDTLDESYDRTVGSNGKVTTVLGNNGLIELKFTELDLTKVWDDANDVTNQRPDHITVQIYKDGNAYGSARNIYADDCETYVDENGNDVWHVVVDGLPYSDSFVYTIQETGMAEYDTYISTEGYDTVITNSIKRGKLAYELYLVNAEGTPINEYGESVSFTDRTVISDLVEVEAYINSTTVIDYDELNELLPDGYYIYNPDTSYSETFKGAGSNQNTASVVDDETGTTKVFYPTTATIGSDGTVSGLGDYSDVKIAFAIAKIEILPDVIVVDYGKTILCSPLDNDAGAITLLGVGGMDSDKYGSTYTSQNGVFRVEGNNVTFSPFSYMSSINRTAYYVTVRKNATETEVLSSTIFVIPATTVYYEDDFGGSAENGGLYIEYTGDWYNVTDDGEKTAELAANTDLSDRQDRGEVGDGHVPYGYDSSYSECTQFSNGSATMVEGTVDLVTKEYNAYAEFYFTGTGFDIISRTDLDCGMISVYITDEDGEFVSNVPVINKGVENLYQIPVISYTGIPYGTYKVRINVNAPMGVLGITGSTFYLDAIRIYDPMGLSGRDNWEFDEANAAYSTDKEANAYVASIRDYILSIEQLGVDEETGAVYVDTIDNEYTSGGVLKQDAIEDFHITGPNEEVYLTPGKGIGFALICSDIPESVQLEIKIPAPLRNSASLRAQTNSVGSSAKEITVQSATEMFYDITDAVHFEKVTLPEGNYYRAVVVLTNGLINASESEIVSITNVKMTYNNKVMNIVETKDGNQIASLAESTTVIDGDGNVVEQPTQVAVGFMASWDIYCDVFDTIYTQHQATIPTYDVAVSKNFDKVSYGEKSTAVFTSSQFVNDLIVTDENGNKVNAYITSDVDEDNLYTASYGSAKTWTVTVAASEGEHTYTVKAANGEGSAADANVEVEASKIVSLKVLSAPSKTKYNYGDTIDTTGLVLEATYSDGTVKQIKSGYTLNDYKADHAGNRTIKVYYNGAEASFKINVKVTFVQIIMTIFGFGWLWKK